MADSRRSKAAGQMYAQGQTLRLEIRYLKAAIRQPKRRISAPAAGAPLSAGKSCSVCRCYWWGKIHGER